MRLGLCFGLALLLTVEAHADAPISDLRGAHAVSVNRSNATLVENARNTFVRLRLFPGAASVGAFYGPGTGNKAMLGLSGYDRMPLRAFRKLSFRSRVPAGAEINRNVYVNFVVDLRCKPRNPDYAVIVVDAPLRVVGPQGRYHRYAIGPDQAIFRSVGGEGGLPGHLEPQAEPLSTLLDAHPAACLVNADPFDNGMPRHTTLPSVLLILGDSQTTRALSIDLDDLRFVYRGGADRIDFED